MSCGPAEALKGLADGIDILDDKIDSLIEESPLGKLNELKGEAEAAVNGVMDAVNVMIPEIGLGVLDGLVPAGLQDDIKGIASFVLAGIASKDAFENKLNSLKSKYENMDLGDFKDLDDVVAALRSGALDLDNICKLIPNFEEEPGGIGFALKGVPTSFPEIDPVALLKGGKLPDFPKFEFDLEVEAITKEATDEFLQFDLPKFGF